MSDCPECNDLCELRKGDVPFIGSIAKTNTLVNMFVENVGTKRIEVEQVTTGANGEVHVDLTKSYIQHGQHYEVAVSESGYAQEDEEITPVGQTTAYDCVTFKVVEIC
jgi:hypothetical protein